jgi:hypothetical protein
LNIEHPPASPELLAMAGRPNPLPAETAEIKILRSACGGFEILRFSLINERPQHLFLNVL